MNIIIGKFWDTFGEKLVARWIDFVLPSLLFWSVGALAWVWFYGLQALDALLANLTNLLVVGVSIAGLITFFLSVLLVNLLVYPARRILEGRWPKWLWALYRFTTFLQKRKVQLAKTRWQELMLKVGKVDLSLGERFELEKIEMLLHRTPRTNIDIGPTQLGNIQRASEIRIRTKYGLSVDITLPRLKLLLPDVAREELESLSNSINLFVLWLLWGLFMSVWAIWFRWVIIISVVVTVIAYRLAVFTAVRYATILESCYDLYRFSLYKSLRFPLPKSAKDEKEFGEQINQYIWRGLLPSTLEIK